VQMRRIALAHKLFCGNRETAHFSGRTSITDAHSI
jgi:hypothetical protein